MNLPLSRGNLGRRRVGTFACAGPLLVVASSLCILPLAAQTRLKLTTIVPGSERTQLLYNGDFQLQGAEITNAHPFPIGWIRQADMFADAGVNLVPAAQGTVAQASTASRAKVGMFRKSVTLVPNTAYVLSAYLWNMGQGTNTVNTVVDLADATGEAQLLLASGDPAADQGYFVYQSFNTSNTGTNLVLRAFYDGLQGTGAAAAYYPLAAQWDNIAITKASDFQAPSAAGSGANMRPAVAIVSPLDGSAFTFQYAPASLTLAAAAADFDGAVASVEFFQGATSLGIVTSSPYEISWNNLVTGTYTVTAKVTDDHGATTLSAPVTFSVITPKEATRLRIVPGTLQSSVYWPTSATAFTLQVRSSMEAGSPWYSVTNVPNVVGSEHRVVSTATNTQTYFRLSTVDASTLRGKLMMGYQGWFSCTNDGSQVNRWVHWFRNNSPVATNATIDFWPDVSELDPDELFDTAMTMKDGSVARVYSAYKEKTVVRHFRWMRDHHLDGVFLQRFSSELSSSSYLNLRNKVLNNVRVGAETYGRTFGLMYDISGQAADTLVSTLLNDWASLASITNSPSYIRHNGKPVVAIWGFGFKDRPGTPDDALFIINAFKSGGLTVMGGVPSRWRTLGNDSQTNAAWATVYRSFDIVSPWAVGRFGDVPGADTFKNTTIVLDLVETARCNIDYMPVVFPGFSWHNLKGDPDPMNKTPRKGGAFYWHQVYNAVGAGCNMLYGAMFDEMDEGTAMFKLAATTNDLPVQGTFVPLNIDGYSLPSDWYLKLADQAGRMLRSEIPVKDTIPISP